MYPFKNSFAYWLIGVFIPAILLSFSAPLSAQVVDDVIVKENSEGYEVEIKFFIPLRHQSHSPKKSGKNLEIQLRPENFADPELEDQIKGQRNLSWDRSTNIPLKEVIFDGNLAEQPSVIIRFTKTVNFKVRNSPSLRSIIISIETSKPAPTPEAISKPVLKSQLEPVSAQNLIVVAKAADQNMAKLLDRANQAMLDKNYSNAVQLFTKILSEGNNAVRPYAQELLGVAREYNGQLAHAKAEYQKYLELYPDNKDARRVNQRLAVLITAAEKPKEKLSKGKQQRRKDGTEWDTQFYGSFSQFYFRDETTPEDEDAILIRSDLVNDLDFVGRARKGEYDLRTQFIGSYREDFRSDSDGNEFIPSILSVEGRHSGTNLYARLGRQSRTTGGILGRFDGIHGAYEMNAALTLNAVFGYPVDISDKTNINTDQEFFGVSMDIGTVWDGWDFNTFYITQDNAGIKDREAVGGEVRYYDANKSFFTLVDYDLHYSDLNIFLFIGSWTITEGTTLNLVFDYRNSPILTTTNAIQGQGVENLEDLFTSFTTEELEQFAQDRTSQSKSVTTGITQQLNENWQVIGEVTIAEFGSTPASGGVAAIPGTGKEYFYSTQFITNNVIYENDTLLMGLRYSDTMNSNAYTVDGNWRVNINRKLRLNPRIRFDYRETKDSDDDRLLIRPFFRVDYRFRKWMKFEFDLGYEWLDETFANSSQSSTAYFLSIGYRAQF